MLLTDAKVLVTTGMKIMSSLPTNQSAAITKLKLEKKFQPCHVEDGDEAYQNGIFEFNITRLLAFLDANAERFPITLMPLADIPDYGGSNLDEVAIRSANFAHPILMAEISPGRYSVIDGNHRIAKARRVRVPSIPARKIDCPQHIKFLTSEFAHEKYVEYWNSKLNAMRPMKAPRSGFSGPGRSKSHK
jgi:hypothetical protein